MAETTVDVLTAALHAVASVIPHKIDQKHVRVDVGEIFFPFNVMVMFMI